MTLAEGEAKNALACTDNAVQAMFFLQRDSPQLTEKRFVTASVSVCHLDWPFLWILKTYDTCYYILLAA